MYLQENFKAYNVDFHRHQPEIKDFLQNSLEMNNEIIGVFEDLTEALRESEISLRDIITLQNTGFHRQ